MTGLKLAAAIATGYFGCRVLHTQDGREAAKTVLKFALKKSGAVEKTLDRILTPRVVPEEETS